MEPLGDIAHTIQVALTPVFLISGIGALLNVFNTRQEGVLPSTMKATVKVVR